MLTALQTKELSRAFNSWNAIERSAGRVYADPADADAIIERALRYASLESLALLEAMSAFTRSLLELGREGVVTIKRPIPVKAAIPADFVAQLNSMTSSQLRVRLRDDAAFSDLYSRWSVGEQPEGRAAAQASKYQDFKASDWRSVPPNTLARLMMDPLFRARIDVLVAEGSI